ncbi:S-adenosyl-L-methionine-dependent methyltransferase [Sistotremastrum suecicum HHB10207 ss-3]|uniref:S-adenosyl-L-methionine-dependent methyltransferase n=1 Tax=Sistotremastrum suecicum HHB10207 ss-3 TaxID=1314776 RepID=A0A166GJT6_9AGAM|nr:S-adenosyl-L-methionine-dependent methyltransferase [Sistotremastrum suecicum HHB10207 ss-3]
MPAVSLLPGDLGRQSLESVKDDYFVPLDRRESDYERLELQHQIWKILMKGPCPVSDTELDELLRPQESNPSPAVLDIGCGSGIWCFEIVKMYPDSEIVGMDITPCSLTESGSDKVRFIQNNLLDGLQKFHGKFDVVHCRTVLIHVGSDQQVWVIQEILRCLRPGGLVILSDWDETVLDQHGTRLLPAKDGEEFNARTSWLARLWNEFFPREDFQNLLRHKIHDVLQNSPLIDPNTLHTALYDIPVGWEGENIENGKILGDMIRHDIMAAFRKVQPKLQERGVPDNVFQTWIEGLDAETSATNQKVITRFHSTWARAVRSG